jgi:hypothetical protein
MCHITANPSSKKGTELWIHRNQYALADATINTFKTFIIKIIWILALCFFPPVSGTVNM